MPSKGADGKERHGPCHLCWTPRVAHPRAIFGVNPSLSRTSAGSPREGVNVILITGRSSPGKHKSMHSPDALLSGVPEWESSPGQNRLQFAWGQAGRRGEGPQPSPSSPAGRGRVSHCDFDVSFQCPDMHTCRLPSSPVGQPQQLVWKLKLSEADVTQA